MQSLMIRYAAGRGEKGVATKVVAVKDISSLSIFGIETGHCYHRFAYRNDQVSITRINKINELVVAI